MKSDSWRELVGAHLHAAAEALAAHHDAECVKQFGVAAFYLQREGRSGRERLAALRLQQAMLEHLGEGDGTTERLDLTKVKSRE